VNTNSFDVKLSVKSNDTRQVYVSELLTWACLGHIPVKLTSALAELS